MGRRSDRSKIAKEEGNCSDTPEDEELPRMAAPFNAFIYQLAALAKTACRLLLDEATGKKHDHRIQLVAHPKHDLEKLRYRSTFHSQLHTRTTSRQKRIKSYHEPGSVF